jgi:hypothetical protein
MSWSNKLLQQSRVRSIKLADVRAKAFGMPLTTPPISGVLGSVQTGTGNSGS